MFIYQFSHFKNTLLLLLIAVVSCGKGRSQKNASLVATQVKNQKIITGAAQLQKYLPLLKNKTIAIVSNPTSIIYNTKNQAVHLVDTLLQHQINITKVFAPEHGFRGKADAGEIVKNGIDIKTNIPIVSLYGKNKKPTPKVLKNIDIMVFDIQDVGARFYTYISSLHYVMEACAENNIPILVFDRPNPNGHYIDGPILQKDFKSFVGLHPIPIVHGMTIGEYALIINGEHWLQNEIQCDLSVIKMKHYKHSKPYNIPIKPSPNLPNATSINLYPSLCLFEGTAISVGRGTDLQFQIYGAPNLPPTEFNFIPSPNEGAKNPKHQNKICYGENLTSTNRLSEINLNWLINAYNQYPDKEKFFNPFFKKLAGSNILQQQIEKGLSQSQIKASWKKDLDSFAKTRSNYLLYK